MKIYAEIDAGDFNEEEKIRRFRSACTDITQEQRGKILEKL